MQDESGGLIGALRNKHYSLYLVVQELQELIKVYVLYLISQFGVCEEMMQIQIYRQAFILFTIFPTVLS